MVSRKGSWAIEQIPTGKPNMVNRQILVRFLLKSIVGYTCFLVRMFIGKAVDLAGYCTVNNQNMEDLCTFL